MAQTTNMNPQSLALSALKFLTIASSGFAKRDEERAYVYYMHILNLVASIKRTADFWSNPKFYKDALGIHIKDSLEKVEILSKSLISRYDERQAEQWAAIFTSNRFRHLGNAETRLTSDEPRLTSNKPRLTSNEPRLTSNEPRLRSN